MFNRLGLKTNLKSRFVLATLACVTLAFAISSTPAAAWERGSVENFTVPSGSPMMEGLIVGRDGNVYVSTFDPTGATGMPAQVLTFSSDGTLLNRKPLVISPPSSESKPSTAMLGVAFPPGMDALYVIDFGLGNVLAVNPKTGASSVCITLDSSQEHTTPGLNALTFDAAGNTYVSDSFNGIIWKLTGKACGQAEKWVEDDLLKPNNCTNPQDPTTCNANSKFGFFGVPPFGANGVEFNNEATAMFVCNTAFNRIIKIPVETDGTAGSPITVFTNSINGCDGIAIDKSDNIWAAANQGDEMVVVDPTGKAIAKLGDFNGVEGGATSGLLFPASPAFSKDGQSLFVTNLELDLRILGLPESVDSQWAAKVTRHSIAKLEAQIPQQSGNEQ
jgi:sugar lactone lactonase YvrE